MVGSHRQGLHASSRPLGQGRHVRGGRNLHSVVSVGLAAWAWLAGAPGGHALFNISVIWAVAATRIPKGDTPKPSAPCAPAADALTIAEPLHRRRPREMTRLATIALAVAIPAGAATAAYAAHESAGIRTAELRVVEVTAGSDRRGVLSG